MAKEPELHFFTVNDLADLLHLSTKKIRRLIERGDIAHHRFGRSIRVSQADLDNYIQNCRTIV